MSLVQSEMRKPSATATPDTAPAFHPTLCPPWCKDRTASRHDASPRITPHFSEQVQMSTPGAGVLARAELVRLDETGERPETVLFVQGESTAELDVLAADLFIAQAQAWVDGLRALRREMAGA